MTMEEQKIVGKEVKMQPKVNEATQGEQPKEYSLDELKKICDALSSQNKQMQEYIQKCHHQIQQMGDLIQDKRMDYLFKVVEISSKENLMSEYACFAKDFVESCIAEIQEALTIPEQPEQEAPKES